MRPTIDLTGTEPVTVVTTTTVVIDDRPLVRAGMVALLSGHELDVRAAGGLTDALDLVDRHVPDAIVVVHAAGFGQPLATVAAIKTVHDIPILVISDGLSASDLREAVIAGADGLMLTTASAPELRRAVAATARGERVVAAQIAVELVSAWREGGSDRAALTPREVDVLQLLAEGLTNRAVADRLELSHRTVKTHVQNLLIKLDVTDRTEAVARGFRLGFIR